MHFKSAAVLLLGLFISFGAQAVQVERPKLSRSSLIFESSYSSLFPSIHEYLIGQEAYGFITTPERAELEKFLSQHKVDPKERLPGVKVDRGNLNWGQYRIEVQSNGDLKLQNGRIVHLQGEESFASVFKKTFTAMTGHPIAAQPWMIDEAEAGEVADRIDAASDALKASKDALYAAAAAFATAGSGALALAGWTIGQGIKTIGDVAVGTFTVICGGVAMPLELVRYILRWQIYNERIECDDTNFTQLKYPPYLSTVAADLDSASRRAKEIQSIPTPFHAPFFKAAKAFCLDPAADLLGASFENYRSAHGWDPDSKAERIRRALPASLVKKALGITGEALPKCNKELASQVENFVREESKKSEALLANGVEQSSRTTENEADSTPQH